MKADQNLIDYIEAEEEGKSATGVMGPFLKHIRNMLVSETTPS